MIIKNAAGERGEPAAFHSGAERRVQGADSGTMRGRRFVQGGPRHGPRGAVHGAPVATKRSAVIRAFYRRLIAAGKPKNLALVTCMRKLLTIPNVMVPTAQPWPVDASAAAIPPLHFQLGRDRVVPIQGRSPDRSRKPHSGPDRPEARMVAQAIENGFRRHVG